MRLKQEGFKMKKSWNIFDSHRMPCHTGPVEVVKNLFCGSQAESLQMVSSIQVDILVPLDSLDGRVWELGFRGEILYCPIQDYGVLPTDVLNKLVSKILCRLKYGKKIGLFCQGGHGRTGYVASVVLGKLGYEDPIGFLRQHYCEQAVESSAQVLHIAEVLGKPKLAEDYAVQNSLEYLYDMRFGFWDGLGFNTNEHLLTRQVSAVCGRCLWHGNGQCRLYHSFIDDDESACEFFQEKP